MSSTCHEWAVTTVAATAVASAAAEVGAAADTWMAAATASSTRIVVSNPRGT